MLLHDTGKRRSPWPPDVRAADADDILASACRLSAHNIPARVEPDHQEPQALQIEIAGHRGRLNKQKASGAKEKVGMVLKNSVIRGMVWYGMV